MPKPRDNTREYRPKEYKVVALRECVPTALRYDTPERIAEYWRENITSHPYFNPDVECFVVVLLNSRQRANGHALISTGGLDSVLVHPREVFRAAIIAAANAVVLMHNHPSGDSTPSDADIKITRDMVRAGQLLKLEVLDHVIMGRPVPEGSPSDICGYTSLRSMGYFY